MTSYLHKLSGILFYIFGTFFFVAYLFLRNEIIPAWAKWWLNAMDLPMAVISILYGGISLYLSLKRPESTSKGLAIAIAVPLVALFTLIVVLNFWDILGLPIGEM